MSTDPPSPLYEMYIEMTGTSKKEWGYYLFNENNY
jgi:hypothetical protein